jgi:hypothetical protein
VELAALQPAGALEWASTDVPNENVALARASPAPRRAGPAGRLGLGLGAATRLGANRIATERQWLRVEAAAHSRAAAQLVRIECKPDAELQGFGSASICKSTYESVAGKVYHFRFRLSLQAKTPAFDYHGFDCMGSFVFNS